MKCLVTGGAGFIGSHLVEALAKEQHEVVILDNLDPYYDPNQKVLNLDAQLSNPNVEFVRGDIRDDKMVRRLVEDSDVVFHEAGRPGVRSSMPSVNSQGPWEVMSINYGGTLNVLNAALETDSTRVILASSSSIYGETSIPTTENSPKNPSSFYGLSKLAADRACLLYSQYYGLPTTCLRYFSVYGPRQRPDMAIHEFTQKIVRCLDVQIFGDGQQKRDNTYVSDVVEANLKAASISRTRGEAFNIGTGRPTSVIDLIAKIASTVSDRLGVTCKPKLKHIGRQNGDVRTTQCSPEKAARLMNWQASTTLDEGLEAFIEWHCGARCPSIGY